MSNLALKQTTPNDSGGARLVSVDGRTLPLRDVRLDADAKGGVARVTLRQKFHNSWAEPLRVTYLMPLPADGAVSGYAFVIGSKRIVGQVDRRASAREQFERAILEGRSAAILDQERSSLFTQELGNVPPNTSVEVELVIDQKLRWLPEGSWEWRFPTVVAPRYMGAAGAVADLNKVMVAVNDGPLPVTASLALVVRDRLTEGARPESLSHALHSSALPGRTEIGFRSETGAALDRDVVVRWSAVTPNIGISVELGRAERIDDALFGLLTVVPPSPKVEAEPVPRDLIVLLDTSGSMGGKPLAQAKKVVAMLIDSLGDSDRLELIEFSNAPRRWKNGSVEATAGNRSAAQKWLAELDAGGGTEMAQAMIEALTPLRDDAQRQVVLVTDGLIGFEYEVLQAIGRSLPARSRVHVVGVGSAVNRSLSHPATRLGRGEEVIVSLAEDPERAAQRLVARTRAPLVTELRLSGDALLASAPARLPDLFAASPALLPVRLNPRGGELVLRGTSATGAFEERLKIPPALEVKDGSPAVAALFGREAVEDLEVQREARLTTEDVDPLIEELGLEFQISTRLTSWVAVSDDVTVDPSAPTRTENVPHELAYGISAEGVGLRSASRIAPPERVAAAPLLASAPPRMSRAVMTTTARAEAPGAEYAKTKQSFTLDDAMGAYDEEPLPTRRAGFQVEPPAGAPTPPVEMVTPEGGAVQTLEGVRRLFDGNQLVVDLIVDRPLSWRLPRSVRVRFDDGTEVEASIDPGRTTAAGAIAGGRLVRVALMLSRKAPPGNEPRWLSFDVDGTRYEVVIR